MASELVINSLKYAFGENGAGCISVSLKVAIHPELIVEDDGVGVGLGSSRRCGMGVSLLDELGAIIGATISRGPGMSGRGLRVAISLPAR